MDSFNADVVSANGMAGKRPTVAQPAESAFWQDIRDDLENPEFREAYVAESERLNAESVADPASPVRCDYDRPGVYKPGPGCWVVNDSEGRRLGLITRGERSWRPECDRGCDHSKIWGDRERCVEFLFRHWRSEHGWAPAQSDGTGASE